MQTTTNIGLKKPGENDFINVEDLNHNADIIDQKVQEALDKTVDIVNDLESDRQDAALSAAAGKRLFQSASNGKSLIAGAVTGKGVSASSNDTFAQLAGKITQIKQGKGNATPDHVIFGRTFSNDQGDQTGTMPNRGNWSSNMSIGGRVTIPQGYHAGDGAVTADVVPGRTITPTTYEQTAIGPGSIARDTIRVAGDPDLQPRNIKLGVDIFGVRGTAKTDYSAEQSMIANAITVSGNPTSTTESWAVMAEKIKTLPPIGITSDPKNSGRIALYKFDENVYPARFQRVNNPLNLYSHEAPAGLGGVQMKETKVDFSATGISGSDSLVAIISLGMIDMSMYTRMQFTSLGQNLRGDFLSWDSNLKQDQSGKTFEDFNNQFCPITSSYYRNPAVDKAWYLRGYNGGMVFVPRHIQGAREWFLVINGARNSKYAALNIPTILFS